MGVELDLMGKELGVGGKNACMEGSDLPEEGMAELEAALEISMQIVLHKESEAEVRKRCGLPRLKSEVAASGHRVKSILRA